MKIVGLKSRGVESASWATIPPISRDRMTQIAQSGILIMVTIQLISRDPRAKITRSEICIIGHDPSISREFLYR